MMTVDVNVNRVLGTAVIKREIPLNLFLWRYYHDTLDTKTKIY